MSNGTFGRYSATMAKSITLHDTNIQKFSLIYVGVGGDVTLVDIEGNTSLWKNCPTGLYIPVQTSIVKATGTTATNLVGIG